MQNKQQTGNIALNILLIIMFIIIAVLIYILAGGNLPRIGRTSGIQSPTMNDNQNNIEQVISQDTGEFSDGLTEPNFSAQYPLDEFGTGISQRDIFDIDINQDGHLDRITRTRNENGTPHFYYDYKIELNQDGKFIDITPPDFKTVESMTCSLQKLQFVFRPEFRVIKISRNWSNSWTTPTMAYKTIYSFNNTTLQSSEPKPLKIICNVVDLF